MNVPSFLTSVTMVDVKILLVASCAYAILDLLSTMKAKTVQVCCFKDAICVVCINK